MNHTGHALPASGRRSAPQTCCSADCRCLSWAASPERVSSSRRGLPHQGHRDPSLSLLFLPSMGRGWSRAPSCPRQEGNSARGESDLGKEAGLELNSALLPHSHHAPPQGSPPGPLGPFASWVVALRGLSGSWLPGQAAPPSSPWRPCTITSILVVVERGCGGGLTLPLSWLQRIPSF